jgi:hypothetical protein
MLEPCDAKVSRTVLRGLGDRKVARLLGKLSCTVLRGLDGSNPVRLLGHVVTPARTGRALISASGSYRG